MATKKKQNRRSVSMKGPLYARLENYCKRTGTPVAALVEQLIKVKLDDVGEPAVAEPPPRRPRRLPPPVYSEDIHSQHFTF